ncbi:Embryonic polyadenylate-binding protein 2 [Plecturocebus cupreus]
MWPIPSCSLFPPPTQAWLQTVSSDPEAQGWGAWNKTKNSLGPEGGEGKEEREEEAEEDQGGDEGFLLSLLEQDNLAEFPMPDQELEAIKMKVWAMERSEGRPQPPGAQRGEEEDAAAGQLLSPETTGRPSRERSEEGAVFSAGCPVPGTPEEKVDADRRSVYVGNVDYGGSAEELEAHFSCCGKVYRVTILCDKFSGHPKGSVWGLAGRWPCAQALASPLPSPPPSYAYIEFATKGSVQAAMQLDQSLFRGRVIKVRRGSPGPGTWAGRGWPLALGHTAAPAQRVSGMVGGWAWTGCGGTLRPEAGFGLYCRKEPTSLESAPQTAGAFEDTQAPGGHPFPTAASRASSGSDHEGRTSEWVPVGAAWG